MAKWKSTKGQTTTYKTHIKLDQVTRTSQKIGVNSGALEGFAVPAPLVAPSWMSKNREVVMVVDWEVPHKLNSLASKPATL